VYRAYVPAVKMSGKILLSLACAAGQAHITQAIAQAN
jgi:hypothetical protein